MGLFLVQIISGKDSPQEYRTFRTGESREAGERRHLPERSIQRRGVGTAAVDGSRTRVSSLGSWGNAVIRPPPAFEIIEPFRGGRQVRNHGCQESRGNRGPGPKRGGLSRSLAKCAIPIPAITALAMPGDTPRSCLRNGSGNIRPGCATAHSPERGGSPSSGSGGGASGPF